VGQLGNRVQHALRAYTPADQKAVKAAAQTFRANPKLQTEKVITELGIGEALVSFLDEAGAPGIVERAWIYPPYSHIGPITPQERQQLMTNSAVAGVYEKVVDRDSAYEKLKEKGEQIAAAQEAAKPAGRQPKSTTEQVVGAFLTSAVRAVGSSMGRQLIRGVLGGLMGGAAGRKRK
jgi:DNA helicase HerA-like ATPase